MDNGKVNFGIIGCGSVAPYHASAIRKAQRAELVLVADSNPQHAVRFSERFQIRAADSVEQLLEDPSVDAVSIAVPVSELANVAGKAIEAGKHVFVEKPLAMDLSQARALVEQCNRNERILSVWFERRYQPFVKKAREIVSDTGVGDVEMCTVNTLGFKSDSYWTYGFRNDGPLTDWRRHADTSGGGVLNLNSCHQIDLILHITGLEVVEVFAFARRSDPQADVETSMIMALRCRNGELINVVASSKAFGLGRYPIYAANDLIIGSEGSIVLGSPLIWKNRLQADHRYDDAILDLVECKTLAVEDYCQALLNKERPPIDPSEAIRVLSIIRAAYQSVREGGPVSIG